MPAGHYLCGLWRLPVIVERLVQQESQPVGELTSSRGNVTSCLATLISCKGKVSSCRGNVTSYYGNVTSSRGTAIFCKGTVTFFRQTGTSLWKMSLSVLELSLPIGILSLPVGEFSFPVREVSLPVGELSFPIAESPPVRGTCDFHKWTSVAYSRGMLTFCEGKFTWWVTGGSLLTSCQEALPSCASLPVTGGIFIISGCTHFLY